MAKSMHSIEMNFARAVQQAQKLEEIAGKIEQLTEGSCQACLNELSSNWKGEGANAFLKKGNRLKDNMKESARNLKKTGSTIREIARRTYDAEKRAYQLASSRTYQG